ncbi:conserved protein of unknown function [Pseudodesulfovibrio profundus]|uniref:Phosphonate metabolism protein n=1 Tax=Pseudodesulfovibrio profundus TaxID=57320 RepID=A0A2C8FBX2_9BACT|nr:DUF1045 domain-containing protein [Pseudodesulfovibrio profundus]SOB60271.1 conserved protein of unknown function [Pseudodesulfovibrio profundus]
MPKRYAIYYAPERNSMLDVFGKRWVGRCAETGKSLDQPQFPGISPEVVYENTRSPRHYGFHGTLVPPFELKEGFCGHQLIEHAEKLARSQSTFVMEPLSVMEIGSFIALVPAGQDTLARLAEASLRWLEPFRQQPSLAELERRRAKGLTPTQERFLVNWGYPYVLEEFRFHLTLTDSIRDKPTRKKLFKLTVNHAAAVTQLIHPVRELCVFRQENRESSFILIHRAQLGT